MLRYWYAVDRTTGPDGADLKEPVRQGVWATRELALEYIGRRRGSYHASAYRITELTTDYED